MYNEAPRIAACLEALLQEGGKDLEIILVDDGSTDDTVAVASRYPCKIIRGGHAGPAAARNLGVGQATGEILLFIDADVEVEPGSLKRISAVFQQRPEVSALVGIRTPQPLNPGLVPAYWALWKFHMYTRAGGEEIDFFSTNRGAMRREAFDAVGEFDTRYRQADIEDFTFGYRLRELGHRIILDRDFQVRHHFPTLVSSLRKTIRRTAQWAQVFADRRRFDRVDVTAGRGILAGILLLALLALAAGLIFRPLLWAGLILAAFYLVSQAGLFFFILRHRGPFFTLGAIGVNLLFNLALALGAVYGLVALPIRRFRARSGSVGK